VIQIDKQHRQLPGLAFRQANGLLQAVVDQNAVGQVGQGIVFGQMLDAGLMFLAFGNIGKEGNMVGDLPCSSVSTLIFSHSGKASPFLRRFQISPDHCPRWLRLATCAGRNRHRAGRMPAWRATAQHILLAIAGDLGKGLVDRQDAVVGIGDQNGFIAGFEYPAARRC
jgi:hypothetical protein